MIKIAALDDDDEVLEVERKITNQFFEHKEKYEFHGFHNENSLFFRIAEEIFDIYLLDMELPGTNGLEVARKIKQMRFNPIIIYVTNFVEYAVEAFEVNAFRYIPKKLLTEKLPEAYEVLLDDIKKRKVKYLEIQNGEGKEIVPEDDIYCLLKDKKYVNVIHDRGESRIRTTLTEVYKKLSSEDFIRIDKSCVVNLKHVMELKNRQVRLRNDEYLDVSQPQLSTVKKRILEYWRSL